MVYYHKEASHFINGPLSHASSLLNKKKEKDEHGKFLKANKHE